MQIMRKTNYESFLKVLKKSPDEIIEIITKSLLKGRGGASFSTGMKWKFTKDANNLEKYLIVNFDEGEPGTFKDKFIADNNMDLLIEGILIASYVIGVKEAFIYLRGEYKYLEKVFKDAIDNAQQYLNQINLKINIFLGAGAYICGDETSIMNSIEGIRGEPRSKPPLPAIKGLWECPTCINNVETLANVPLIIDGNWEDLVLYSISGDVSNPGVFEEKKGVLAKDLLKKAHPRKKIKALFFGCAGGCAPFSDDLILDDKSLKKLGCMFGSGTIIAIGEFVKIPKILKSILDFFVHESCGKCTPCREGTFRALEILKRILSKKHNNQDLDLLIKIANCMKDTSFCGLGQTAGTSILSAIKHFRGEFEQ